jgi:hypothetical protein
VIYTAQLAARRVQGRTGLLLVVMVNKSVL